METLAKKLAAYIGRELHYDDEKIAVLTYGLIGIIQTLSILILTVAVGLIFGFFIEVLVVFFSVGFLRRLVGGAHSKGIYNCLCYSVIFVCGISAVSRYLLPRLPLVAMLAVMATIYLLAYLTVAFRAPVSPPNKPCKTEEKRRRLRRGAFLVLTAFLLLTAGGVALRTKGERFYTFAIALSLSTLWQTLMLTPPGAWFIRAVDGIFGKRST